MNDWTAVRIIARQTRSRLLSSVRMKIMFPILVLFIPGLAWGFSDPQVVLPGGFTPNSSMEAMYYASLGVIFGATMAAVLLSFDGVSRERASGMLEIRLAQPIDRIIHSRGLMLGHWSAIAYPVWLLQALSVVLIRIRMGEWLTGSELLVTFLATGMLVWWYTVFALLSSSVTKDVGTSIAFGVGIWFFFTFLWALVTSMVAYASGVPVGEANNASWVQLEGLLDLLSPNGVFHHMLETQLESVDRGIPTLVTCIAATLWSLVPMKIMNQRMEVLIP